jgi:hypothetical protein
MFGDAPLIEQDELQKDWPSLFSLVRIRLTRAKIVIVRPVRSRAHSGMRGGPAPGSWNAMVGTIVDVMSADDRRDSGDSFFWPQRRVET